MRLIAVSIAWVGGAYLGSLVSPPLYAFLLAFVLGSVIALLWRRKSAFLWAGLCLIVLFGGIGHDHELRAFISGKKCMSPILRIRSAV